MIIIETCPKCGRDLRDEIITTNPPIPRKVCYNCGWSWEGHPEQVVRVPFGGNSYQDDNINLLNGDYLSLINNFTQSACLNCPNNPKNGGDGICFCTLGQQQIIY